MYGWYVNIVKAYVKYGKFILKVWHGYIIWIYNDAGVLS